MLKSLSLFSGCMGLDLGLELAGIEAQVFVENNSMCQSTIRMNRPNAVILDDVFSPSVIAKNKDVDIVVGGPPCQPFSSIGKMEFLKDTRAKPLLEYINIVQKICPLYFVFENVEGIIRGKPKRFMVEFLEEKFKNAGYTVRWDILNAADFGVPQNRKRFIMIGRRGKSSVVMPQPFSRDITLRETIADLENTPGECMQFRQKLLKYLKKIQEGKDWRSLNKKDQRAVLGGAEKKSGGLTGYCRRLHYDRPAPTLLTSPCQKATTLCHPMQTRPLSVAEYKRIQGFPDNWKLAGSVADKYRQLGNAVPILLGKAIGSAIVKMK